MIWALIAIPAALVIAALLRPLLKTPDQAQDRAAYDLAVFQDQLKEVEKDVARGVLTAAEADAAKLEIQRRMVAAVKAPAATVSADNPRSRRLTAAALGIAVPVLAVLVYLAVGQPGNPNPPIAAHDEDDAQIARMVDQLAAKVAANPKDPDGVLLLARTYRELGRYDEAAKMFAQLTTLKPDADAYASYAETTIAAANGQVDTNAHDALVKALTLDRSEPKARFYLGLEQAEQGNAQNAIAIWRELTASAPPDTSWLPMVRQQMAQVAQAAGIPPMSVQPKHPLDILTQGAGAASAQATPAPAAQAPAAQTDAGGFTPEQRQMIEGMVGGLAARLQQNPDDYNGWMMLGRSYTVLKRFDDASAAYEKAIGLKPKELQPRLQVVNLLLAGTDPDAPGALPERLTKAADGILALDANQPDALYVNGLARAKAGDKTGARERWTKAQGALPDGAPLKVEITRRLKTLG